MYITFWWIYLLVRVLGLYFMSIMFTTLKCLMTSMSPVFASISAFLFSRELFFSCSAESSDKGCLLFREGLCFVLPGEGSIVGSVANVERLSTPSSQRRFCMPLSYPSGWMIQFYKIKSIHFNPTAWCQNNWYYVADRIIEFQSENLELTHSNFFSLISKNSSPRFAWRGIIFIEC